MASFARSAAFGLALVAVAGIGNAKALSLEELGRHVPGFYEIGVGGFGVADFDGDGRMDLAIPGSNGGSSVLEVFGATDAGLAVKQIAIVPDVPLVRLLVSHASGEPHPVTIAADGTVREFGGWPLTELRHFSLGTTDFRAAAIGDIDADGREELVISAGLPPGPMLRVYDFATATLRWVLTDTGGDDILLEQLDGDPALEIVLANTPGTIIDGATHAVDWTWDDGFGLFLAHGKFAAESGASFVAARNWDLFTVFQSAPYAPVWNARVFDIESIAAADLDGDSVDEIIEGDGQWGTINIYSSQTHTVTLSVPKSGWGVRSIATIDFERNGAPSIAYGAVQAVKPNEALMGIFDAATGATEWQLDATEPGPYAPVALGDLDDDGATDFVFASEGNGYSQGILTELDASSGEQRWQSPAQYTNANAAYYMDPAALRVLPGANGGAGSLIVAGTSLYSGRILKVDGATHDVLFQIGEFASGPMADRYIADIAVGDFDGDGTPEIAACTYAASTAENGARLQVFSSADGSSSWESETMGSGFDRCNGVMAGRFDAASNPVVVAVLPWELRAYDATSHALAWTLPVEADGATPIEHGVAGPEIAVFSVERLTFYDAATRAELRHFDFDDAVNAVREVQGVAALAVTVGGRLLLVDGHDGAVLASGDFLGDGLGHRNQLAVAPAGGGAYFIAVGSNVGAFRFRLAFPDAVFANGFDS